MNRIEDQTLISLNPATGEEVGRLPITPVDEIPAIVARAREAQIVPARLAWCRRLTSLMARCLTRH